LPAEPSGMTLSAVAAVDADTAWAVGDVASGTGVKATFRPLALAWNGRSWAVQPVPQWPGTLSSVAAVDAHDAWAIGGAKYPGRTSHHLLHWDGRAWSEVSPAAPAAAMIPAIAANADLTSVAADRCGRVFIGGQDAAGPLLAQWDGHGWVRTPPPPKSAPTANSIRWNVGLVSLKAGSRVWISLGSDQGNGAAIWSWDGRTWHPERLVGGPHVAVTRLTVLDDDHVWFVATSPFMGGPSARPGLAPHNWVYAAPVTDPGGPGGAGAGDAAGQATSLRDLNWYYVTVLAGHTSPEWVAGTGARMRSTLAHFVNGRWRPVHAVLPPGTAVTDIVPVPDSEDTWLIASHPGNNQHPPVLLHFTSS
jgi:hypothetical protein